MLAGTPCPATRPQRLWEVRSRANGACGEHPFARERASHTQALWRNRPDQGSTNVATTFTFAKSFTAARRMYQVPAAGAGTTMLSVLPGRTER